MKLIIFILTLWSLSVMACPSCPSGSSTSGAGPVTNLPGCRCSGASDTWNGSSCVPPTTPPPPCSPNGSLRFNASTGTSDVCSGGNWVARSLNWFCTPPYEVKKGDDEWMKFYQTSYTTQGSPCTWSQRSSSNHADLDIPGSIRYDDRSIACSNNTNCVQNETVPSGGACPAMNVAWVSNGLECRGSVGSVGNGATAGASDADGNEQGGMTLYCRAGVWQLYNAYCYDSSAGGGTCQGYYIGYYGIGDIYICDGSNKGISYCCATNWSSCTGSSAECP